MIVIVPEYYQRFVCKAAKCRHSCCRDWEIDIDETSADRFRRFPELMKGKADLTPGSSRMILTENGDCPFLTEEGLCRLILSRGEDFLCQICADHPRFRNFYDDHEEMGLGLCCEKTGELLFAEEHPVRYLSLSGEDPWDLAKKVGFRVKETCEKIKKLNMGTFCWKQWGQFLLSLERLDPSWTTLLSRLSESGDEPSDGFRGEESLRICSDRFLEYLVFRHGKDRSLRWIRFCHDLCIRLWETEDREKGPAAEDFMNITRLFSSEIEYSDENMERIEEQLAAVHGKEKL